MDSDSIEDVRLERKRSSIIEPLIDMNFISNQHREEEIQAEMMEDSKFSTDTEKTVKKIPTYIAPPERIGQTAQMSQEEGRKLQANKKAVKLKLGSFTYRDGPYKKTKPKQPIRDRQRILSSGDVLRKAQLKRIGSSKKCGSKPLKHSKISGRNSPTFMSFKKFTFPQKLPTQKSPIKKTGRPSPLELFATKKHLSGVSSKTPKVTKFANLIAPQAMAGNSSKRSMKEGLSSTSHEKLHSKKLLQYADVNRQNHEEGLIKPKNEGRKFANYSEFIKSFKKQRGEKKGSKIASKSFRQRSKSKTQRSCSQKKNRFSSGGKNIVLRTDDRLLTENNEKHKVKGKNSDRLSYRGYFSHRIPANQ